MRAVRFEHYGGVDVLEVWDVEDPVPGDGQLLVRVRAAGINPGEAKIREGELDDRWPATFPSGQGSDLAGVVESVGPGVTEFEPGDEVIGFSNERASQAELVLVQQSRAVVKPQAVPWEVAGGLFVAGCTAYAMVDAVDLTAGDTVIVAGATGGVGAIAVQLAARRGVSVLGIASSRNAAWLQAHGVTHIPYGGDPDALEQRIRAATTNGDPAALLDCYGPPYVELGLRLGIPPQRIDTIVEFGAAASRGVKDDGNMVGARPEVLAELANLVAEGRLEVPIARTFALEQVRDAYTALQDEHPLGKIVLLP